MIRAAVLLMVGLGLAVTGWAQEVRRFELPRQDLAASLNQLAVLADWQIVFAPELVKGRTAAALSGQYTPSEALNKLLGPAGLRAEYLDSKTVAVRLVSERRTRDLHISSLSESSAGETQNSRSPPDKGEELSGAQEEQEMVVTGSHIRGVRNGTSPIMEFDREFIERSGYTNMMQLAASLPLNFNGGVSGASETAYFGRTQFSQNLSRGTGFNLRGLGSASTLTLINGRRMAPSAQGQFVDISNIPLAAVDRIEILTDGASAIYGADAVAGVVNIVLRKDFNGFGTALHLGGASRGGTAETEVAQTYGTSWSSGNAVVIADLHQRNPLDGRDRDYILDAGGASDAGPTYILPKRRAGTLIFNLDQALPGGLDFTSNVIYSYEEVSQAQTYSDGTLYSNHPLTNQGSALFGLGYKPFSDWRFELNGSFARVATNTDLTYSDVNTGEIFILIDDYYDRFNVWSSDLRGDGSLFGLPAGKVRLAVGTSYRHDFLNSTRVRVLPPGGFQVRARDKRNVTSAYAELFVPIVGKEQGVRGARRIELSLAGRYDDYSDFGNTTNPKFGLVWSPIDQFDLRASYGTSFRAPTVAEKALGVRGGQISTTTLDAPGGGQVPIFYLLGSALLSAEKSRDKAIGFTYRPWPSAELSFNYFHIDYRGRISQPPYQQDALMHRGEFGNLITDIGSDAAAQAFLDQRLAAGDLYIDFEGTGATGVRYVYDLRQQNAARTRMNGYDVTASYSLPVAASTLDLTLNLTHTNEILSSLTATTTAFDQVNTFQQPLKTRVRGMATWLRGRWDATAAVNNSNAYINNAVSPNLRVKSWTTVDLNLGYDFGNRFKASLAASNLLDKDPPYALDPLGAVGYDVANGDPMGRYLSARLTVQW